MPVWWTLQNVSLSSMAANSSYDRCLSLVSAYLYFLMRQLNCFAFQHSLNWNARTGSKDFAIWSAIRSTHRIRWKWNVGCVRNSMQWKRHEIRE